MSMSLFTSRTLIAGALGLALTTVTGCGLGNLAGNATEATTLPALSGKINGGPNPIVGARVVLYATSTGAYGGAPSLVEEANQQGAALHQDTDVNGSFQFPGGVTCPAGEYVYVVAYGGNTGANTANPNSVLMTALGSCSSLYSGTTYSGGNIFIDELTTIAAGYALNNFMSVTGDPVNGFTVNMGAPATNHATTGCVANSYYSGCTTTAAAGLAHAFNMATALVSTSTGVAQTTTARVMPVAAINTLGNALQACVNSTGGGTDAGGNATSTATTNDGTVCGKLFEYTSYSVTTTNHYPTNTLQAVMNLVKRPAGAISTWTAGCAASTGGTVLSSTCLYGLASPTGFYAPVLTTAPADWMLGITYSGTAIAGNATCATGTQTTYLYPYYSTLDINDNVYTANSDSSSQICQTLIGQTFDGTQLFSTNADVNIHGIKTIATDALGHVFAPNQSTGKVYVFDAAAGTDLTNISSSFSTTWGVAVDLNNNVYFDTNSTPSATTSPLALRYTLDGTSTHTSPTYTLDSNFSTQSAYGANTRQQGFALNLDAKGNVWIGTGSSTVPSLNVVSNAGQDPTSVNYNTPMVVPNAGGTGSTSNAGYATIADLNGNGYGVWSNTTANATTNPLFKFTPTFASNTITALTESQSVTSVNFAVPKYAVVDANNLIYILDNGNGSHGGIYVYDATNNVALGEWKGCYAASATANTTCANSGSTNSLLSGGRSVSIDSTGSIWVPNSVQKDVVQVIGLAAPAWPQLSLQKSATP